MCHAWRASLTCTISHVVEIIITTVYRCISEGPVKEKPAAQAAPPRTPFVTAFSLWLRPQALHTVCLPIPRRTANIHHLTHPAPDQPLLQITWIEQGGGHFPKSSLGMFLGVRKLDIGQKIGVSTTGPGWHVTLLGSVQPASHRESLPSCVPSHPLLLCVRSVPGARARGRAVRNPGPQRRGTLVSAFWSNLSPGGCGFESSFQNSQRLWAPLFSTFKAPHGLLGLARGE